MLTGLVGEGSEDLVTPDNFTGLVNALDEFATAAGIAVDAQQQGRRTQALTAAKWVLNLACRAAGSNLTTAALLSSSADARQ